MDQIVGGSKPMTGFFRPWWGFIKLEYSSPRDEKQESAQSKNARLSRFRITQNQADLFQIGSTLAVIGMTLFVAVAYSDWFTNHDILIGKFHGNIRGFAAAAVLFLASHLVVSLLVTLVWLVVRKPIPASTSR